MEDDVPRCDWCGCAMEGPECGIRCRGETPVAVMVPLLDRFAGWFMLAFCYAGMSAGVVALGCVMWPGR